MDGRQNMLALLVQGEHAERLLDQNTHLVHDQQKSTEEEPAKLHGMENSTYFFDAEKRGGADESSRNDDPVAVVPQNYGESEMPENQKSWCESRVGERDRNAHELFTCAYAFMQREDLGFLEIGSRKSIHNHSWLADDIKVIFYSLKYRSIQTFSSSSLTVDWLTQLRTWLMVKGKCLDFQ